MSSTTLLHAQPGYDAVPSIEAAEKGDKAESLMFETDFTEVSISQHDLTTPAQDDLLLRPYTLSRTTHSSWYFMVHGAVDAVLAIGPIFFFIIAGLCIGMHGKPTAPYGNNIQAITLLSPTIFPIIYAGILGTLLRRIGLYKVERGSTMGDLERLIGSQSIFSAVERLVGLRKIDMLGVSILLAWLLSPLGGQASLRLLSVERLQTINEKPIYIYPIRMYPMRTALPLPGKNSSAYPFYAPLFVAALQTSQLSLDAPMDIVGNVKVPDLYSLSANRTEVSDNDWHTVRQSKETSYTSIFGIPIAGIPTSGVGSFSLVSHYWSVDCDRNRTWKIIMAPPNSKLSELNTLSPSFDIIPDRKNTSDTLVEFTYFSRTSKNLTSPNVVSLNCHASPVAVESMVSCRDRSCRVIKIRRAEATLGSLWNTSSGSTHTPRQIFNAISERMPGVDISATQDQQFGSELVERWILGPELSRNDNDAEFLDLSLLERGVFIQRLTMAINTFWDSTVDSEKRMGKLDPDIVNRYIPAWDNAIIQVKTDEGPHYVCHFRLAGITMAISFVLLLAANLSMLLGLITRTPDALGFVSMAARDNPHFKRYIPSHFDGKEVARLLRDVKIVVGDVRGDEEVGHIALATVDTEVKRLSWTKPYD